MPSANEHDLFIVEVPPVVSSYCRLKLMVKQKTSTGAAGGSWRPFGWAKSLDSRDPLRVGGARGKVVPPFGERVQVALGGHPGTIGAARGLELRG